MYYPAHALYIFPVFLISILLEGIFLTQRKKVHYSFRESWISLAIAIGHRLSQHLPRAGFLLFAWQHRLATLSLEHWWNILLLFFGIEFFYYWYHRAAHRSRWLWATHMVHHSPRSLNLSAAFRLGWTSLLSGNILFFMPLAWLGFDPLAIVTGLSLNLIYQFWIHTEWIPKLGVLEWIFNTPSHHRVHHASNLEYLDRNYGGVLIIFDRIFGTFAEEQQTIPPRYGLTRPIRSNNPFTIVFHEWIRMFQEVCSAKSWCDRMMFAFAAPDWQPKRQPSISEESTDYAALG
jgi:sterol desaturase/sphingolipid hydroxylase (fatty acid hydroxylase superfamily)